MKEILGLIRNIPNAARHHSLRWHIGYTLHVAGSEAARVMLLFAGLVTWHAVTLAGFVVYQAREVLRCRRR
jgi:hypothetical protein